MKLSVYFKINAIDFLAEVLVMCVLGIKMAQIVKLKKKTLLVLCLKQNSHTNKSLKNILFKLWDSCKSAKVKWVANVCIFIFQSWASTKNVTKKA